MSPFKSSPLVRLGAVKSLEDFHAVCSSLGIELPAEALGEGPSPLAAPAPVVVNGKRPGNRIVIHPMEGWDGTTTGGVTDEMRRRWRRFGESGAKMICGAEAMAVRPEGRANPRQLVITDENKAGIAELVGILKGAHQELHGSADDLVIGFQLTHSGRFCRPQDKRCAPRVAFRHPILDRRVNIVSDDPVLSDAELEEIIADYVRAARVAWKSGADFVDIKHCHGYLLHEFLGARTRPGKYGGAFENRTRALREIVAGIRADGNPIDLGVRLSLFDMAPYRPDPERSEPGKLGPGIPEDFSACLPYQYGFGVNQDDPTQIDLAETFEFVALCVQLGVKVLNTTAGSPYYTPHIQRPAAFPPSDGYQPAYDPLIDVARQIHAAREVKTRAPQGLYVIGSGYTYLQEFLPPVATAVIRRGWADAIGVGRAALSYPGMLADAIAGKAMEKKLICRTFSDCTTAPRNGLVSGCYPLDKFYTQRPEFARLKEIKKGVGG
ncbi:MAG: NADH:flavin oxidoreductase [Verrucomicrobia bacterium]|nr:NADH:flavin oxidoreductase [Verrucomicrobiota bacterium]MBI3868776.1 NADH:flavin oxidoreductase [Verrucomicrobiota bacterium]